MSKKNITLGIFGGGQLGKFLVQSARKLKIKTIVYTDSNDSPAIYYADDFYVAKYTNKKTINKFIKKIDVATFEFENIPFNTLRYVTKTVKTLHKTVLPRAARLNVDRLDPILLKPPLDNLGDKLRAVIAAQILRCPVLGHRLLQPVQHIRRLHSPLCPQHMALTRVFIQNRQQLQGAAAHGRIRDEVPRPHMIPMRRRRRQPG